MQKEKDLGSIQLKIKMTKDDLKMLSDYLQERLRKAKKRKSPKHSKKSEQEEK